MWELIWQALADIQARNVGVATKQCIVKVMGSLNNGSWAIIIFTYRKIMKLWRVCNCQDQQHGLS